LKCSQRSLVQDQIPAASDPIPFIDKYDVLYALSILKYNNTIPKIAGLELE